MPLKTGVSERPEWRLAVVVGVGGMGMAVARRLGERNRLLLVDLDGSRAEAAAKMLCVEGFDAVGMACDITDADAVAQLADRVAGAGPLGVLAHVAGLSSSMGSGPKILTVNLLGAARVEAALLPLAQTGTAAIFISSVAAYLRAFPKAVAAVLDAPSEPDLVPRVEAAMGGPLQSGEAYGLSKQGLIQMCQRRASAWGRRGARIVSLSPGLIASPMGALEFKRGPMKYELLNRTPLRREGTLLEIADAVEFLSSDRASFINGTDLLVDGGLAAATRYGAEPQ